MAWLGTQHGTQLSAEDIIEPISAPRQNAAQPRDDINIDSGEYEYQHEYQYEYQCEY